MSTLIKAATVTIGAAMVASLFKSRADKSTTMFDVNNENRFTQNFGMHVDHDSEYVAEEETPVVDIEATKTDASVAEQNLRDLASRLSDMQIATARSELALEDQVRSAKKELKKSKAKHAELLAAAKRLEQEETARKNAKDGNITANIAAKLIAANISETMDTFNGILANIVTVRESLNKKPAKLVKKRVKKIMKRMAATCGEFHASDDESVESLNVWEATMLLLNAKLSEILADASKQAVKQRALDEKMARAEYEAKKADTNDLPKKVVAKKNKTKKVVSFSDMSAFGFATKTEEEEPVEDTDMQYDAVNDKLIIAINEAVSTSSDPVLILDAISSYYPANVTSDDEFNMTIKRALESLLGKVFILKSNTDETDSTTTLFSRVVTMLQVKINAYPA